MQNNCNNLNHNLNEQSTGINSIKSINASTKPIFKLIGLSFHGVNKLFLLSFENGMHRLEHTWHYLPTVEMKDEDLSKQQTPDASPKAPEQLVLLGI